MEDAATLPGVYARHFGPRRRGLPSAGIAASGMSAEALVISVRTVDNLPQRADTRLVVSSHREAAVALGVDVPE